MKVYIEKENKYLDVNASKGTQLLELLKINPSTVLIVKNNEVVLEDEQLDNNDEIKILSVISGG